jgi:AraC-like DNA-binding protein
LSSFKNVTDNDRSAEALAPASSVRRYRPRHAVLREFVSTIWTHVVPDGVNVLRVVPDAAIDLVFAGGRLRVAGPDSRVFLEPMSPGTRVLGFQLRAGAARCVLGVPAAAVRDGRIDMHELWGSAASAVVESMAEAPTIPRAADALESALVSRLTHAPTPDTLARAIVEDVRARFGAISTSALADELGLSERQLHRRCVAAFGYGPKLLARIVRLQSMLTRLSSVSDMPFARVAVECGYADQAHFTHDVRALTGLTPRSLRSALVPMSDFDKTAATRVAMIDA